jgi:hypothetical protein
MVSAVRRSSALVSPPVWPKVNRYLLSPTGTSMPQKSPALRVSVLMCPNLAGTSSDTEDSTTSVSTARKVPGRPGNGTSSSLRTVLCAPSHATR